MKEKKNDSALTAGKRQKDKEDKTKSIRFQQTLNAHYCSSLVIHQGWIMMRIMNKLTLSVDNEKEI